MRTHWRRAYRMGMPDVAKVWTREEVLALPDDGKRYELVDGELLVSPSPRPLHQYAQQQFNLILAAYVNRHRLGGLLCSPADLDLRSEQLVQPDLFVLRQPDGRPVRAWADAGIPLLVVEILSPTTARFDRTIKRPALQQAGVSEVWLVDLDARLVERWRPDDTRPEVLIERLDWRPVGVQASLGIDLGAYFAAVLD